MRMITAILTSALSLGLSQMAFAKPMVADLSNRSIAIDSRFAGTDILLFGARNETGKIVGVVRGPDADFIVRKKERIWGMWMNRKQVRFNNVDGFYRLISSQPLTDIKNDQLVDSLDIGFDPLTADVGKYSAGVDIEEFRHALLRHHQRSGLYPANVGDIAFISETLFRSYLGFPDTIPRGTYTTELYIFNDGLLSGVQSTPLVVEKIGFEAFVYDLAHQRSAVYGVISIILSLSVGWFASFVFRRRG